MSDQILDLHQASACMISSDPHAGYHQTIQQAKRNAEYAIQAGAE